MSPVMPHCSACHGPIESVAQLQISKALEDKPLCSDCFELAQRRRQVKLF